MSTDTDTIAVDPIAAEKSAANADVAELTGQVDLYSKAAAVVENKLLLIQRDDLQPITSELSVLRARLARAQARVDIAELLEAGPSEAARTVLLRDAETAALHAYRRAEQTAGSPREQIVREWHAVTYPYAESKRAIGLQRADGTVLTELEHQARFYKAFVAIVPRMAALSTGLTYEERLAINEQDAMRATAII